ncbi:hypothetical protein J7M28_02815 [bacterium]|nr:hypothetical protein [bacterium]
MKSRGRFSRSALAFTALVVLFGSCICFASGDQMPPETYIMGSGNKVYEPYFDDTFNGRYDPGEPFVDLNRNGLWDVNVFIADRGLATSKWVTFCYTAVDDSITNGLARDDNVGKIQFSYFNPFTSTWSPFTNQSYCVLEVPEALLLQPVPDYDTSYTFMVRAKDPAGNIDPEPASRVFYVGAGYLGVATSVGAETIVDKSAAWSENALAGLYVNPNINQTQTFLIVGNTLNRIYVAEGAELHAIADAGSRFWVIYPIVKPPKLFVTNVATRNADRLIEGTGNEITLGWTDVAQGFDRLGTNVTYNVYRNGVMIAENFAQTVFVDPGSAIPGSGAPLNGVTYKYQVEASISGTVISYKTPLSNEVKASPIDLTVNSHDILQVSPGNVVMGLDTDEIVFTVENTTKTKPIKWTVFTDVYYYYQTAGQIVRQYGQYLWSGRFTDAKISYQVTSDLNPPKAQVLLLDSTASWEPGELVGLKITIAERFQDLNANGRLDWVDADGNGEWNYGEGERSASGVGSGGITSNDYTIVSNTRTSLTVDGDPTSIGSEDCSGAGSYYFIRDWSPMSALSISKVTGEVMMEPDEFTISLNRDMLPEGWFNVYLYIEHNGRDPYPGNLIPHDPIVRTIEIRNGNPLSISRAIGVPYEDPGWGTDAASSTLGIDVDTIALANNITDGVTNFNTGNNPTHKSYAYWAAAGTQAQDAGDLYIGCFLNPDVSDLAQWTGSDFPPQCYRISSYQVQGALGGMPAYTTVDLEMPSAGSGHIGVDRRDYPSPSDFMVFGETASIDDQVGGYTRYRPWGDGSDAAPMLVPGGNDCWSAAGYGRGQEKTRGQWTGDSEVMVRLTQAALGSLRYGIDPDVVATAKGDYNDVINYWWRPMLLHETSNFYEGTADDNARKISDYYIRPTAGSATDWQGCRYVITTGSADDEDAGGLREECAVVEDSPFVGLAIALDPVGQLGAIGGAGHYFITQAYNPETFFDSIWVQQWLDFASGLSDNRPDPPAPNPGGGATTCDCDATGSLTPGTPFKDANHNCVYDPYPTLTFLADDIAASGSFSTFVIYDSDGDDATTGKPRRWSVTPSKHTLLEPKFPVAGTGRANCNDPDEWSGGMAVGSYPLLVNTDGMPFYDSDGNGLFNPGDTLYTEAPENQDDASRWLSNYIPDDLESQDLYTVIEPGETVTGFLVLTNKSVANVLSVSALIAEYDPYVTLVSNNLTMYDNVMSGRTLSAVPPGAGVSSDHYDRFAFKFTVSEQLPCYTNGYDVTFYTKVFDSWGGVSYDDSFRVKLFRVDPPTVVPPAIDDDRFGYSGTSPFSNGDGVIQAGERIEMPIRLRNESCLPIGNGSMGGLNMDLSIDSPFVSIDQGISIRQYGYILPGGEGLPLDANPEYEFDISPDYDGSAIPFELQLSAAVTYGTPPPAGVDYVGPCYYTWRASFCENPKIYGIEHYNKLSGNSTGLLTSSLIDENGLFSPGSLTGLMLNPNTNQSKTFAIISNTVTSITVDGDLRTVSKVGDSYEVVRDATNIVLAPGETVEVVMTAAPGKIASFNFEQVTRERVTGNIGGVSGNRITDLTADFDIGSLVGLRIKISNPGTIPPQDRGTFHIVGNSETEIVLDADVGAQVQLGDSYQTSGSASYRRFFQSNVRMYDDGLHKDGVAGDGVYVGTYTVKENDDIIADVIGYLEDLSSGNVGYVFASRPLMIDLGPPAPPANVTATIGTIQLGQGIRLEWDINTEADFAYCREAGYAIFRSEDPSLIPRDPIDVITWATGDATTVAFYVGPEEPLTDDNGNGQWDPNEVFKDWNGNGQWDRSSYYVDGTVRPGVTYYYFIKAFDAYGNSSDYSSVVGLTLYNPLGMGVDSMPDSWEEHYGLKPLMSMDTLNDDLDYDNDGLTNLEEFLLHTNPTNPDTDKNGECDGSEYDRSDEATAAINPFNESLVFNLRPGGYAGISTRMDVISSEMFRIEDEHANWALHELQGAFLYAGNSTRFEVVDNTETAITVFGQPYGSNIAVPDYYWVDGAKNVRPDTSISAQVSSVYGIDPRTIGLSLDGIDVPKDDLAISPCYVKSYGDLFGDELSECWVVDTYNNRILELGGSTMNEIGSITGDGFYRPEGFALDPRTGALWIADTGNNEVVKLKMLSSISGDWEGVLAQPGSGTLFIDNDANWVPGSLVGYTVYYDLGQPFLAGYPITENTADSLTIAETVPPVAAGTTYAIDYYVVEEQCRILGLNNPRSLAVDWVNGTCWVADTGNDRVIRLEANIEEYGPIYDLDIAV